jgi:O-antigen/teichoic acid export membrane protein
MLRKTFRNFASQLLSIAVSLGDRFVLVAILLRAWSTDHYADWATISACAALLGLADFGFVVFLGNRLQKAFNLDNEPDFQRLVGFGVFAYGTIALIMLAILAALVAIEMGRPFLFTHALSPFEAAGVLMLMGLSQILHSSKSAFTQIYRGRGDFARGNFIDSVSAFCIILSAIVAAVCGANTTILALVYVCAHLVFGWGFLLTDIRKRYRAISLCPLWPQANDVREAALAMRWYSLGYALPLIWLQGPVLILSMLGLSGAAVVTFVIHRTLVNFCRTFTVMLSTSAGVELTSHVHMGNSAEIERGIVVIGQIVAAIGGVMVGGVLTFGGPLIHLWTGKLNLLDVTTLLWLAVPAITVAPAIPLLYLAQLADLPKPVALTQLAQTALAIVLALLLVRRFGSSGVAFALAISETLAVGVLLPYTAARCLKIEFWRHAVRCLGVGGAVLAWAGCVAKVVEYFLDITNVRMFALGGVLWFCATVPAVAFLVLPGSKVSLLRGICGIAAALFNRLHPMITRKPRPSCWVL